MQKHVRLAEETVAVVLAGGKGTRLGALTRHECKPALPFGGRFRNIDFTLSNCVNSGIHNIGVATQFKDASLIRHLEREWQENAEYTERFVSPWRAGHAGYRGTADAVFQNWTRIESMDPKLVLILAGDHVYQMDYRPMLERHKSTRADLTIGCVEVPIEEASQFGVLSTDQLDRVTGFSEKPDEPSSMPGRPELALGSMGIYVFNRESLHRFLNEDARNQASGHDFGGDLIPRLVDTMNVVAYPFTAEAAIGGGYWRDVGTVSAYWRTHMELLDGIPGFRLDDSGWPIHPYATTLESGLICTSAAARSSRVRRSLLAPNCCVLDKAIIHRSVLCEGVTVAEDARLRNAVILPDVVIGRRCRLTNVIVEAGVHVPDGTVISPKWRRDGNPVPTLISAKAGFATPRIKPIPKRYELSTHTSPEMQKRTDTLPGIL